MSKVGNPVRDMCTMFCTYQVSMILIDSRKPRSFITHEMNVNK